MQRDIIAKLNAWKASEYRKPLILKGARQVGKTWALKEFGRTSYLNFVYLTLEEPSPGVQSEYAQFFEGTRDPRRIISNLSLALGQPIEPGETLLIIDEIQDCPSAVGALKYFCDEAPEYHVACAGSLLGVRLSRETSAFPVGKVEFMEMRPMSFSEFLKAEGAANYDEYLGGLDQIETVPDFFHVRLVEHLRRYFACGGMPEALGRWVETGDIVQVDKVLSDLGFLRARFCQAWWPCAVRQAFTNMELDSSSVGAREQKVRLGCGARGGSCSRIRGCSGMACRCWAHHGGSP